MALVLIQTVCENFGKFTERQVNCAIALQDIQSRMTHPTDESFKQMVSRKTLDNCSIVARIHADKKSGVWPDTLVVRRR